MSSIAKRCIRGHFTLAYLIIARLINIELDWSVSTYNSVAVTITHWRFYTKSTSTVVINLFFLQIHIIWIVSLINWNRSWPVFPLCILNELWHGNCLLSWKISYIIRLLFLNIIFGFKDSRAWSIWVECMSRVPKSLIRYSLKILSLLQNLAH